MVEIYAVEIVTEQIIPLYCDLLKLVSIQKKEKIKNFVRIEDAYRSIIGELLVYSCVVSNLKISPTALNFSTNVHGKPFLKNYTEFQFNLSHSGRWVVCALSSLPVGIDIEFIGRDLINISSVFTHLEQQALLRINKKSERIMFFYELWTLKESYLKTIGKGLSIPLDSFSILKENDKYTLITNKQRQNSYYFKQYDIDRDYKLAVCSYGDPIFGNINYRSVIDIYRILSTTK